MGKLSNGVQKRKRNGKFRLIIDFRYRDKDGRERRYRKDARIQTRAGAEAEARRLMEVAHTTGTLELRPDAPTLHGFVDDTFKPLFRTKDRDSMMQAFDLFDYDDVVENADAIVGSLRSGQMPCDGAWPAGQVDTLQPWIDQGKPA